MKRTKLKLELESLVVESFDTGSDAGVKRGTVRGYAPRTLATCQLCPQTSVCLLTVDDVTCVATACNNITCTCPPPTQYDPTCADPSCGLTHCVDTCNYCMSFVTDSPQRC